ncbi:hypothetical protein, partial [Enterococcus faecium]
ARAASVLGFLAACRQQKRHGVVASVIAATGEEEEAFFGHHAFASSTSALTWSERAWPRSWQERLRRDFTSTLAARRSHITVYELATG